MDPVREAARALARGDALGALGAIARLDAPPALLLKGIAYAQMGESARAREALLRAQRTAADALTKARARAALVELDLERGGDLVARAQDAARSADDLDALGDTRNAAMQRLVAARAAVLAGRLGEAAACVDEVLARVEAPDVRAVARFARAELAVRAVAPTRARAAIAEARRDLEATPNALLSRALDGLEAELIRPIARVASRGEEEPADLFTVEAAAAGRALFVDACRRVVVAGRAALPLARRPVLFALLLALARAWPAAVPRDALAAVVFEARRVNASHRARLRVEIGRLRALLRGIAAPSATKEGYALVSRRPVVILLPPLAAADDPSGEALDDARVALLLADGAAWTAPSIAEHAGVSRRTAQRALKGLVARGKAVRLGAGRSVRYAATRDRLASRLLLLGLLPRS